MFVLNRQQPIFKACLKATFVKYVAFSLSSLGLFKATMANASATNTIFNFDVKDIEGNTVQLSQYEGYVTLIVNVASQ